MPIWQESPLPRLTILELGVFPGNASVNPVVDSNRSQLLFLGQISWNGSVLMRNERSVSWNNSSIYVLVSPKNASRMSVLDLRIHSTTSSVVVVTGRISSESDPSVRRSQRIWLSIQVMVLVLHQYISVANIRGVSYMRS